MAVKINRKANHAFGTLAQATAAIADGTLQTFDLVFLTDGRIGWVGKDNTIKLNNIGSASIAQLTALPTVADGDPDTLYVVGGSLYAFDGGAYNKVGGNVDSVEWDALENTPTTLAGYGIADAYKKTETDTLLADKVDKETGKGLSTNDYTTAEKTKLAGVSEGANKTEIVQTVTTGDELAKIKIDGVETSIYGSVVDAYTKAEADALLDDKADSTDVYTKTEVDTALADKVDKITGKGLSTNDFTDAHMTKLNAVNEDAEENVQSDWNQTDNSKDDFIKNKPTLGDAAARNTADILADLSSAQVTTALGYTPIDEAKIGAASGVVPLNADTKISETYLPAYISEIKEYTEFSLFPTTGSASYLYFDQTEKKTYRWSGTAYTEIASSLSLGTTSDTAFAGDHGQTAYEHSLKAGTTAYATGMYKVSVNDAGHVTLATPVTKADIEALGVDGSSPTEYVAGTGINITGTTIKNTGVTAITQSATDGKLSVTTNGSTVDVPITGLKDTAFKASTEFATAAQGAKADSAVQSITTGSANGTIDVDGTSIAVNGLGTAAYQADTYFAKTTDVYTKTDADNTFAKASDMATDLADKANSADVYAKAETYTKTEVNTELAKKVDAVTGKGLSSNDYTTTDKTTVSALKSASTKDAVATMTATGTNIPTEKAVADYVTTEISGKADSSTTLAGYGISDAYTKTEVDGLVNTKANASTTYSKTEVDNLVNAKADSATTYTKTEVDTAISGKVNSVAGKGLSTNDLTDALKTQYDAAEENQNAVSKILVNGVTISADAKEDTFVLAEGSNITLTADASTKTVTISSAGGGSGTSDYDDTALKNRLTTAETSISGKADKATTLVGYGITNAYTKTEVDGLVDSKADASTTYTKTEVDGFVNAKANASTTYSKTEVDSLVDAKADSTTVYTKTEVDGLVGAKADASTTYTKTAVDGLVNAKADASTTYTKTEVDTFVNAKADASAVYAKSDVYNTSETDALLNAKADLTAVYGKSDVYLKTEVDTLVATKYDKSQTYTKTEVDNLVSPKANSDDVYAKADTYSKTEVNTKLDDYATKTYTNTYALAIDGSKITLTKPDTTKSEITLPDGTVYEAATTTADGLMTKTMVTKLNGIEDGAQKNTVDSVNGKTGAVVLAKADVGLGSVENKSAATILSEMTKANVTTALGGDVVMASEKGTANGVAQLNANGKVPNAQLPAYLDSIVEGTLATFPATGNANAIYFDTATKISYRWSGSEYVNVNASNLVLGETSSTAYAGDKGKIAYDHAMTKGSTAYASGFYKVTVNDNGHVTLATAVEKADIEELGYVAATVDQTKTFLGI